MAGKTKANLFLENLQKRAYLSIGRLPKQNIDFNSNIFYEILEKMLKSKATFIKKPEELKNLRAGLIKLMKSELENIELPTKYEDPITYILISKLAKRIEESADDLSIPIAYRPIIGTLPTGRVNAMAIAVPSSDEFIIVFESGLFIFALLLSKALNMSIPFKGTQENKLTFSYDIAEVTKKIDANPEIVNRFRQVLFAYLLEGRPSAAPQYILEEPYMNMAEILIDSMELFVMGHEYGHIINNHFLDKKTITSSLGNENVNEIILDWKQELEADAIGIKLMIHAMQKNGMDLALSYWGADFFFSCHEIIERSISILHTGKEENIIIDSHPPVHLRRQNLRNILTSSLPEDVSKGIIKFVITTEQILEILWEKTCPLIHKSYEENKQLAPIWQK